MHEFRPIALSIAGFDPSGGAGVLADVKTFEQHRVYGLSIITANTCQTEDEFFAAQWIDKLFVEQSIIELAKAYSIKAVKIGIVPSLSYLLAVLSTVRKHIPDAFIVWDTVLQSSTGFTFIEFQENETLLANALSMLDLITPNYKEIFMLGKKGSEAQEIAESISANYCAVLLKGGHNADAIGTDYLFAKNEMTEIIPHANDASPKHGSGCVLAAAIAANIALGKSLYEACVEAKKYIEQFLKSNPTLSGYHVQ